MTLKEKSMVNNKWPLKKGISTSSSQVFSKKLRKTKKMKVGDICLLKISALGPKNIGIDEYTYGYSIFVPNVNLGELVKVKIVKISGSSQLNASNGQQQYAVGQVLELVKKESGLATQTTNLTIKPDQVLTVNIEKLGKSSSSSSGAGIVNLNENYKLIIPNAKIGNNITVIVTRVKSKYAFAKMEELTTIASEGKIYNNLLEGSKYSLNLPKTGKYYGKYVIVKLEGSILFIKLSLGAKPGNKVRIKITKINNKFAIAKVIQINPTSLFKKRILVQNSICQMVKNGMHLGEKAVKCNARMKNYVWLKKRGQNKNRPLIKKGRHIINLLKTRRCLNKALVQLSKYALKGRTFMFIGTKKPAAGLIARASLFSKTSFFVNTRWLGGMLTNWKTILKSISKIRPILKEKQKIVADILAKRQAIKLRLIKKALLLKKKK